MTADKIKVAVRVRPFNERELNLGSRCVVKINDDNSCILEHPMYEDKESRCKMAKSFSFDNCFDSSSLEGCDQERVFQCLGPDILQNSFEGYNSCVFAYGQTGSGKSYTMMGNLDHEGLIPRICRSLFAQIEARDISDDENSQRCTKVEVSYMEIYNERVRDLLQPTGHSLKVREHSALGPYVDGLSRLVVLTYDEIEALMLEGNKSRTVAVTSMNHTSSRSHAVFSVILTQLFKDAGEKVCRLSFVDLAGSERVVKSGTVGQTLKEGSNINRSLTTLGLVISKLADQSSSGKPVKDKFIPYRDSTLTWLLKDNLGGNSRTLMLATLSPSADNYDETLSTLRYADRAKRIETHAIVNEDPNGRIIRELREQVVLLKHMLKHTLTHDLFSEQLKQNEKLVGEYSLTWEEKQLRTEKVHEDRRCSLKKRGVSVGATSYDFYKNRFYLVNLNVDPSLNEILVYYLKPVSTIIGLYGHSISSDIQLSGLGIQPIHCVIKILNGSGAEVRLLSPCAHIKVNGIKVVESTMLFHGDRILIGSNHIFRFNYPIAKGFSGDSYLDWNLAQEEILTRDELHNDSIACVFMDMNANPDEKLTKLHMSNCYTSLSYKYADDVKLSLKEMPSKNWLCYVFYSFIYTMKYGVNDR